MKVKTMAHFDEGILSVSKPELCGCQELLNKITLVQSGWLRRKCRRNALQIKYIKWPQQYVIVGEKCLYYFNSETAKQPEGAVSLYGFNRITRASDVKSNEAVWAFKLEHIQPHMKSIHFAASSEKEMVTWMKAIKAEMLNANNISSMQKKGKNSSENLSRNSWDSADYGDLENSIYDEAVGSRTSEYSTDKDEEVDEPEHPPLPPRSVCRTNSASTVTSEVYKRERNSSSFNYSLQKNFSSQGNEQSPKQTCEKVVTDPASYWASVHFSGGKSEAAEIVGKIADNGTYLIRKSDDDSNVLLFYSHPGIKKFKIIEKSNGWVALTLQGPEFQTIEDMLYHYYSHDLPGTDVRLVTPYSLHRKYQIT